MKKSIILTIALLLFSAMNLVAQKDSIIFAITEEYSNRVYQLSAINADIITFAYREQLPIINGDFAGVGDIVIIDSYTLRTVDLPKYLPYYYYNNSKLKDKNHLFLRL